MLDLGPSLRDFTPLASIGDEFARFFKEKRDKREAEELIAKYAATQGIGQQPAAPVVQQAPVGDGSGDILPRLRNAIYKTESSNRPDAVGPVITNPNSSSYGQRALGLSGVMSGNVGPWTKQYLGREMTAEEFLKNPAAQQALTDARLMDLYKQHGTVEDVASVWHSGVPLAQARAEGRHDRQPGSNVGMDTTDYAAKVARDAGVQVAQAPSAAPSSSINPAQMALIVKLQQNRHTKSIGDALLAKYLTKQDDTATVGDRLVNKLTGRVIYDGSKPNTTTVNNRLVDQKDGRVIADFSDKGFKTVTLEYKDAATGEERKRTVLYNQDTGEMKEPTVTGAPQQSEATVNRAQLTGDDFLSTMEPGRANTIKAIVEGRMAPPGGWSLKSPQVQAWVKDAAQYEPGFDLSTWKARNETRADFAKGKMATNIQAMNTALSHMADLYKTGMDLNNFSFGPANTVTNFVQGQLGDPRITRFETARKAVGDELAKVFRQTGMSQTEIEAWKNILSSSNSPAQMKAAIEQATSLLEGRLQAVGEQFSRGMGKTTDPVSFLDVKAKKVFERLKAGEDPNDAAPAKAAPVDDRKAKMDRAATLFNARKAISKGADPAAVKAKMKASGIEVSDEELKP
jgi:hypothetical protein